MSTLTLILVMTLIVAVLTAAATAVRTVSRIWLRHWAEHQIAGAGGGPGCDAPALERPHNFLLAAGTGIAVVVFALGALIAFRSTPSAVLQHLLLAVLLLLLVGQVVPRAVAQRWGTGLIPVLAPLLQVLDALFGPLLAFAGRAVRRFVTPSTPAPPAPTDPLEDLLREAEAEGIGEEGESEIISGVVEFGEKRVRDVMTPRERVTSVTSAMPREAIAQVVAASNYSRVPVFDAGGRVVLGVLHAFDVLLHPQDPLTALRPAAVAAADEPCGAVMRRMLREHRHLAVVERAGEVTGIVTLEDLMEELVGDIRDEHDEPGTSV